MTALAITRIGPDRFDAAKDIVQSGCAEAPAEMFAFHRRRDIGDFDGSEQAPAIRHAVGISAMPDVSGVQGVDRVDPDGREGVNHAGRIGAAPDQRPMLAKRHADDPGLQNRRNFEQRRLRLCR